MKFLKHDFISLYGRTYHNIFILSEHTNIKISDIVNAFADYRTRLRIAALTGQCPDGTERNSGISVKDSAYLNNIDNRMKIHVYESIQMYFGGEKEMASNKTNRVEVPEAKAAMDRFKTEVASELGVNLKQGYNGDLTSKEAGSIGGEMVRRMIKSQEEQMK